MTKNICAVAALLLCAIASPVVAATLTVTNAADGGVGSLRERIQASASGDTIIFSHVLAGQTLVLTNQIVVTNSLTIDADTLLAGVTIDGGPGTNRLFTINAGKTNVFRGLNLTGGNGSGGDGGAILNNGTLVLVGCAIYSNAANSFASGLGGAISGPVIASNCTFSANRALWAGAINGSVSLNHCTLSGNSATGVPNAFGGAIYGNGVIENSIVAGNTGTVGADLYTSAGAYTLVGTNIVQSISGSPSGTSPINANPLLNALADNGGLTRTMSLQTNSPALDGAGGSAMPTDQRGLTRPRDGNGDATALADIGAFEAQRVPGSGAEVLDVNTVADEVDPIGMTGAGLSLREAVRGVPSGGSIFFDTSLFNGEAADIIILTNALNHIFIAGTNITISATNIPGGVTVDGGPGNIRIFLIETNTSVAMQGLTLTGGNANGTPLFNVRGGAIYNNGTLSMSDCTVISNSTSAGFGGGIHNNRILTLNRCAIANNSASEQGGGVVNFSSTSVLVASNVTFFGNSVSVFDGGGLANINGATSTLAHCTFSGNSAPNDESGGGIYKDGLGGTVTLINSIVTSNTAGPGPNVSGVIVQSGTNIITGDALLGPLAYNGGFSPTMILLPGSPALNAVTNLPAPTDQRGYGRFGIADLGAYERLLGTIADTTTNEDFAVTVPFVTGATNSTFYATSSVPSLIQSFGFGGSGSNRTVIVTPAPNSNGTATITVTYDTSGETSSFNVTFNSVNDAPSFVGGTNLFVSPSVGPQTIPGWATGISPGPANENSQTLNFVTDNNSSGLFLVQPAVASNGTLTFTPHPSANAFATVSVYLQDNGSATPPNVNTSAVYNFIIFVSPTHPFLVTNPGDTGSGSLRSALYNAGVVPGPDTITFDASLSGQTIHLASELALLSDVTIDATSLPAGVTISGDNATRIFYVGPGTMNVLLGLSLTGGYAITGGGGAILNVGTLSLDRCALWANIAVGFTTYGGGAIRNSGSLTLSRCTLVNNSATSDGYGGAIWNTGGFLSLDHCTLSGNYEDYGYGGDAINISSGFAVLANTLAAPNGYYDINVYGPFIDAGNNITSGNPLVGTFGFHGGSTPTLPLLASSPAVNAAVGSTSLADQRGFPLLGVADIGAYERQLGAITNMTTSEEASRTNNFSVGVIGTLSAMSDVPSLVDDIVFGGGGNNRTIKVTPAVDQVGSVNITVTENLHGESVTFGMTVTPVNDAPDFTVGYDQVASPSSGAHTVTDWAAGISPGPADESGQTVAFTATNNNNGLFSSQPSIAPDGTLTYTVANGTSGVATVYVKLQDNGSGTAPNVNTSATQTFQIMISVVDIPNPSFEVNFFIDFPGYVVDNGPITGWNADPFDRIGVDNFDVGYNFADNGTIPDGTKVGFVQSMNIDLNILSTTINGLQPGRRYRVTFGANSRAATGEPAATWSLNDGAFVPFSVYPPVGGLNPYYQIAGEFVATGFTANIAIANQTFDDTAVVVDDFHIIGLSIVTNNLDSGPGSLRQALLDANSANGDHQVEFAPSLSSQTITLISPININGDLMVDASSLPGGVTVAGALANTAMFSLNDAADELAITGITFINGNAYDSSGGVFYNAGTLALTECTLSNNSAQFSGGAINNVGALSIIRCTLSGNTCTNSGNGYGGAVYNSGFMTARHSTFHGNLADRGGAIWNTSTATTILDHVTIAGNTATLSGGGIFEDSANLSMSNSIVAGNSAATETNIYGTFVGSGNITNGNPLLAPLDNYGGRTKTMAILPGSPARNTASGSTATSDQRNFPIIGIPDIGAYEAGTFADFNAWIWETLLPTNANHATAADPDGDGVTNGGEWNALTNPGDSNSLFEATGVARSINNSLISFPSILNRQYTLETAGSVFGPWNDSGLPALPGDGTVKTFTLTPDLATQQYFRVEAGP